MRERIYNDYVKVDNLKDMLKKSGDLYGDRPAFVYKTETPDNFTYITHKEFREDINALGTELIKLGLKNKRIAVISDNRYEWCVSYLSVVTGVGVIVPLDKALPENEIRNLIKRSQIEAIFYSNKYDDIMEKLIQENNTTIKYFISMDLDKETNGILSQKELIQKGKKEIKNGNKKFINAKINNEEMSVMLFTSGTTAEPKAVMLSHKNICANLMDIVSVIKVTENDRFLSFLPLHHTFECTVGFLDAIYHGASTAFCGGIRHIAEDMKDYHISAMISVPVLFETMYKKIIKTLEKQGKLEDVKKGVKITRALLKIKIDVRKKIFKEIHDTFGGKVRILVAGGAALDPETEKGFNDLGFMMYQGYGLTETSPVIAAEDDKNRKIGSIGKAFPSLDVKIDEPNNEGIGELMVKGPSVMIGYYNNEEATKNVLEKDGWFHTEDLAKMDKDGYLYVSGRKKYMIVLKNGKNIYPEEIETLINKIEGVKESIVYGRPEDDGDFKICAKIVYDEERCLEVYNEQDEKKIQELIWQEVKKINKTMPVYKYVKEITLMKENLIKTTTQKIKRHEEISKILK